MKLDKSLMLLHQFCVAFLMQNLCKINANSAKMQEINLEEKEQGQWAEVEDLTLDRGHGSRGHVEDRVRS
jgi:RNA-binding protein YlmH